MSFLYPELLLLALPLGWVLWRTTTLRSWRALWRGLAGAALVAALAAPHGGGPTTGRDLVLVVDRSRSMPGGVGSQVGELVSLLGEHSEPGDRLGIVSFGADIVVDRPPGPEQPFGGFTTRVDRDGSQLADAIDRALALIPENRPGSILLLSDGEYHGAIPDDAARRAALRGVRLDVRGAQRQLAADVAVDSLTLPERSGLGELFQFSAEIHADRATEMSWRLLRDERQIAAGTRDLRRGSNQLLFRDVGTRAGLGRYRLVVQAAGDLVPENNLGLGVTRIEGRRPLLLVNSNGQVGRLAAALRGAGLGVDVRAPDELPLGSSAWLDDYAGVVLENVSAAAMGPHVAAIAAAVQDLGAGLLMTGGQAAYGVGGYYRSALDDVLPVTMELRIEHRKMALALAVVLDRSGSMAATVGAGRTKMDLANAGTIEAIRLLSSIDEVAVIAVDSSPHVVVGLRNVDDVDAIIGKVSGIQSMGGGIYTYTGLLAAAHQLENAAAANRHIILFADASDAEEPGEYKQLLTLLTDERNTTVSVVALGTSGGTDADFLRDVAARGKGEIYFSRSANELPRIFAQDTLLAARSSFIQEPTGSAVMPALLAVSSSTAPGPWITLPGYNLTYLRPGAALGAMTTDDYDAPIVATMQSGLGRSAAYTGQVDGSHGIPDGEWPAAAELLVTLARWIVGTEPAGEYFTHVRREGRQAVVVVERDTERSAADPGSVHLVGPDGSRRVVPLSPVGADRFEARLPLGGEGIYRLAASTLDGELLPLSPLAVSYSPEFETRLQPGDGSAVLGRIARLGRGRMNPPLHEVQLGNRSGHGVKPLANAFVLAALLLLLGEIAWRRFYEGRPRRLKARELPSAATSPSTAKAPAQAPDERSESGRPVRADTRSPNASPTESPAAPAEQPAPSLDATLAKVKRRARRRER